MRLRSAETYWLLKNGLIQSYPSLRENLRCEVLIIGGGITGALMAYQLSLEGYNTTLIDKRDIGMGSTSASTSMLQYEIDEPLCSLIDLAGEEPAVCSYQEGVRALTTLEKIVIIEGIDCDFKRKQSLYLASARKDTGWLMKEYSFRHRYGLPVQWTLKLSTMSLRKRVVSLL